MTDHWGWVATLAGVLLFVGVVVAVLAAIDGREKAVFVSIGCLLALLEVALGLSPETPGSKRTAQLKRTWPLHPVATKEMPARKQVPYGGSSFNRSR